MLATWLHPLAGPVVGMPMLFFLAEAVVRAGPGRNSDVRRALGAGMAFGLLAAVVILPPSLSDPVAYAGKAGFGKFEWQLPVALLYLGAGSRHATVVVLLICTTSLTADDELAALLPSPG